MVNADPLIQQTYNKLLQNAVTADVNDINVMGMLWSSAQKGKMQHLISPTLTLYDNITSPGNSRRTICVCLCVCFVWVWLIRAWALQPK